MDIQFCQDPFAVATYICDYLMKTEDVMKELFKAALKENPSLQQKDKQNLLKTIYLTHRQVGLCEAIYRLIPSMKKKDSNNTTTFVSSGFPQNRCSFVSKFREESEDEDELETDNWETQDHRWEQNDRIEDEHSNGVMENNALQSIEGYNLGNQRNKKMGSSNPKVEEEIFLKDGQGEKYKRAISNQEKYQSRPKSLEKMCLAQFAISYRLGKPSKNIEMKDNCSIKRGQINLIDGDTELPYQICLEPQR